MNLTFRQLQYFVEAAKVGSITQAAHLLHVAPTALSLQIKALEDHFQAKLMERHSRGVRLTDAGLALFERALKILSLVEEVDQELLPRPAGPTIRLGVQPSLARLIGYDAMVGIGGRIAGATLHLLEGWAVDLERRLDAHELDVLVCHGLTPSPTRLVTDLADDRLYYVTSAATATGTGPVTLAEILARPLIFYGEGSASWKMTTAAAREAGLAVPRHSHVESYEVWLRALSRGQSAALAPYGAVSSEHCRGEIVVREVEGWPLPANIRFAIRADLAGEPWAEAFLGFVRSLVGTSHLLRPLDDPAGAERAPQGRGMPHGHTALSRCSLGN